MEADGIVSYRQEDKERRQETGREEITAYNPHILITLQLY
jgi:hypothetical protein